MKIGYVRVSTIEKNLAWHSRSAAQADVQQSREIDRKSPKPPFVQHAFAMASRRYPRCGGILRSLQLTLGCCEYGLCQAL